MARLIMVCGQVGAGKTTYAYRLSDELSAIRFSIDPWMQTLFSQDMGELDYEWMINRVYRCYDQIWEVSAQILGRGGNVILDLGFTEKTQREQFYARVQRVGIEPELHYLEVPVDVRRNRVAQRNEEQDPRFYAFEVTGFMFDFMETRFEVPGADEVKSLKIVSGLSPAS